MDVEIKEKKEVTQIKEIVIATVKKCDVCGRVILDTRNKKQKGGLAEGWHWWGLTTCHNDWGNDSIDSYERYDICSPDCLKIKLEEYCKESNTPYNSKEFNVIHERA